MTSEPIGSRRGAGALLALAAVAVAFAAADTYVVVLALPDMMASSGLSGQELQRAAPIVSGFLLGYVAMLPLIGRIADLRGRVPVLLASLVLFAFGSLVTAAAYDLPSLVTGRFLQGVGGGGLVPVTLALVADIYPAERRAVPLGVVGAVQELGSVLGPLLGAAVLAFGTWRDIFWINLAVGLVLAAGVVALRHQGSDGPRPAPATRRRPDVVGSVLLALLLAGLVLVMRQPDALVTSVAWGGPFVPFTDPGSIWWSQIGVATGAAALLFVGWCVLAPHPLVDLRAWWSTARQADLPGAGLLAVALGGVILAFAAADPEVQVLGPEAPWLLSLAGLAVVALVWHLRRAENPLIPRGSLDARAAWGSLIVSFFVGTALIAALVDIPVFARLTLEDATQLDAALVLVEFLVALPIGAVLGGYLTRALPASVVVTLGMGATSVGFLLMANWEVDALEGVAASVHLVLTGLGFGLVLSPVNAALLASTAAAVHGVSSALLVVARMIGMLVGISGLTALGLRRYYDLAADFPEPREICAGRSSCAALSALATDAGVAQVHAIFLGAAGCAALAGVLGLVLLRGAQTRAADRPRGMVW